MKTMLNKMTAYWTLGMETLLVERLTELQIGVTLDPNGPGNKEDPSDPSLKAMSRLKVL